MEGGGILHGGEEEGFIEPGGRFYGVRSRIQGDIL